jgi:hypothetical protein
MFTAYRAAASGLAARADAVLNPLWTGAAAEPAAVWNLFCRGASTWQSLMASVSPVLNIKYSAVFCHQRPYVRFAGGQCELADALVVIRYNHPNRRHALLLQAKCIPPTPPHVGPQWQLYSSWPTFRYSMMGVASPPRAFPFPSPMARAQYLMLDRGSLAASIEYAVPGATPQTLGTAVEEMIGGRIAAVFANDANGPGISDWSKTIWDLLNVTAKQSAPRRQAGVPAGTPRGVSRLMLASPGGGFPADDYVDEGEWPGPGFVHVEIAVEPGPAFREVREYWRG